MKNFFKGHGNILTLVPTHHFPKVKVDGLPKNDKDALKRDWEMVGKDISSSMGVVDNERKK